MYLPQPPFTDPRGLGFGHPVRRELEGTTQSPFNSQKFRGTTRMYIGHVFVE